LDRRVWAFEKILFHYWRETFISCRLFSEMGISRQLFESPLLGSWHDFAFDLGLGRNFGKFCKRVQLKSWKSPLLSIKSFVFHETTRNGDF
jgi:hypothetical protein